MNTTKTFLQEMEREAAKTRKMLALLPEDKYNWQPHPKSMHLQQLATHLAELNGWITMILNTTELDFAAAPYEPTVLKNNRELLQFFEKNLTEGKTALENTDDAYIRETWTLRAADTVFGTHPKPDFIRHTLNQIVHHRAQLGVYLRLLDIPLPSTMGGSADDDTFQL
jgi:uncharacterized damage-inducible protein DinB